MPYAFFSIPSTDNGTNAEALNRFLGSKRVIGVERQFSPGSTGQGTWSFCVEYVDAGAGLASRTSREKVDYKQKLESGQFDRFARLRKARKALAAEGGVPPFAVATDAQLAEIACLAEVSTTTLGQIAGFGSGKVAKYAERLIAALREDNEAGG